MCFSAQEFIEHT